MHEEVDEHEDADRHAEQPSEEVLAHEKSPEGWMWVHPVRQPTCRRSGARRGKRHGFRRLRSCLEQVRSWRPSGAVCATPPEYLDDTLGDMTAILAPGRGHARAGAVLLALLAAFDGASALADGQADLQAALARLGKALRADPCRARRDDLRALRHGPQRRREVGQGGAECRGKFARGLQDQLRHRHALEGLEAEALARGRDPDARTPRSRPWSAWKPGACNRMLSAASSLRPLQLEGRASPASAPKNLARPAHARRELRTALDEPRRGAAQVREDLRGHAGRLDCAGRHAACELCALMRFQGAGFHLRRLRASGRRRQHLCGAGRPPRRDLQRHAPGRYRRRRARRVAGREDAVPRLTKCQSVRADASAESRHLTVTDEHAHASPRSWPVPSGRAA